MGARLLPWPAQSSSSRPSGNAVGPFGKSTRAARSGDNRCAGRAWFSPHVARRDGLPPGSFGAAFAAAE